MKPLLVSDSPQIYPQISVRKSSPTALPPASKLRTLFSIDPRSLALFRIALGLLLLVDLAFRASDLTAMYTDEGMFPRQEILRRSTSIWNWSFHFASGSAGFQAALFGIAAALAIALAIGWETRLATIGSWLMLVSLHHRVPLVLSGADILLRLLLFWAMFLPLSRLWSIDSRRAEPNTAPIFSFATAAILLQMAVMYFFSAIFKTNSDWLSGNAVAGTLAHNFYASPQGAHLLQAPSLLKAMTWGTLILEWAAPILLFLPTRSATIRMGTIAALALMHLGISLWMEVDLFSFVSLSGLALFLPPEFWNRFTAMPEEAPIAQHTKSSFICAALFLYVLAVNVNELPSHPLAPLSPEKWRPLSMALGLGQRWAMFARVPAHNGWYVARAQLTDGSEVDLLKNGAPLDWTKPAFPAAEYPNFRWRKLFREMSYDDEHGFQLFRAPIADFLCRRWNKSHNAEKQIAEFEFVFCSDNDTRVTLFHRNLTDY